MLFIISLVITVLSTLIPLFNGYFVDSLITADNYRPVFTIGAALILIGVLNVLFSFYENLVSVNLEKTVSGSMMAGRLWKMYRGDDK